jgi:hypothetical protein
LLQAEATVQNLQLTAVAHSGLARGLRLRVAGSRRIILLKMVIEFPHWVAIGKAEISLLGKVQSRKIAYDI